jgi:hypothetical protein
LQWLGEADVSKIVTAPVLAIFIVARACAQTAMGPASEIAALRVVRLPSESTLALAHGYRLPAHRPTALIAQCPCF